MRKYELSNDELLKVASDFNNTAVGRRIWLYSKTPYLAGIASIVVYLMLITTGIVNPDMKELLQTFLLGVIIVLGVSFMLSGIAEVMYWKQVLEYADEVYKEEPKKEIKVKKTVKKSNKKETNKK